MFSSQIKVLSTIALAAVALGTLYSCKPKGAAAAVGGDAAQKVYVAPGKYDEFYEFVSGGFNGQMSVYGFRPDACCASYLYFL